MQKNSPPIWADCLFYGAGDEARTRYLHLGKVALYQMSYTRNNKKHYTTTFLLVNPQFSAIRIFCIFVGCALFSHR